ncbi:MAG TPA: hypothetical protein VJV05_07040 [Pyrinomonadaceae bacterium]|nr:hypothetical protein [Pyrinomonadaceae bacterium]
MRPASSRSRLLVTRRYLIDLRDGYVDYQSIDKLVTVKNTHKYEAGQYKRTQIDLVLDEGVRTVYLYDIDVAEDAVEKIELFRKYFLEASAKGDTDYLESNDDLRDLPDPGDTQKKPNRFFQFPLKTALPATALAVGVMFLAVWTNEYFDDVKSWNLANEGGRASGYRSYLKTHPKGRWSPTAAERLQDLYDSAETGYRSKLNADYDPAAADALSAILRYAKETGNYQVEVAFVRRLDVSETLVEEIKSEFEVDKVLPLGDSFSDEKMLRREANLLEVVRTALSQVFPQDILELSNSCAGECAKFLFTYETTFKDSIYHDTKEDNLPRAERTYSPGILITWKFDVSLPSQNQTYEFELESIPAKTINYDPVDVSAASFAFAQGDVQKLENNNFYDAMVNSAFEDFRQHLVFQLGIGPPPQDATEAENIATATDAGEVKVSKPTDASRYTTTK